MADHAEPVTFAVPRERALVAVLLAVVGAVLLWNAFAYPWERSYDANASALYMQTLRDEHRLPGPDDTPVWHNPPLFFAAAVAIQPVAETLGLEPQRGVQLLSALSAFATVVLVLLLARELFPRSPGVHVAALAVAAATPVLLRAGALYHAEALAAALTTAGLYVAIRALARRELTWRVGLLAGLLLGLANLTRTWALAALAAILTALALEAFWRRSRAAAVAGAALGATAAVLVVPWFAYKAVEHGNPLAYSQPIASQWREHGRPGSFYFDLALGDVFSRPYAPHFSNRLLAVVYSDWWGDYWRSWEIPDRLHVLPLELPAAYERPRVVQSVAGLLPSIAGVAGFVALAAVALRRREAALVALLLSGALLALSFVAFLIRYPKLDGDNIKALYVLNAVPVAAVCAGYAYAWLAARSRALRAGVAVLLVAALAATLVFVLLPPS